MPWNMQHSSLYWAFLQKVSSSVKISLIASRLDTASMSYSYDSPYAYFYDSLYVLFLLHTQAVVTLYCFSVVAETAIYQLLPMFSLPQQENADFPTPLQDRVVNEMQVEAGGFGEC